MSTARAGVSEGKHGRIGANACTITGRGEVFAVCIGRAYAHCANYHGAEVARSGFRVPRGCWRDCRRRRGGRNYSPRLTPRERLSSNEGQKVRAGATRSGERDLASDGGEGRVPLPDRQVKLQIGCHHKGVARFKHLTIHCVGQIEGSERRGDGDEALKKGGHLSGVAESETVLHRDEAVDGALYFVLEEDELDTSKSVLEEQVPGAGTMVDESLKNGSSRARVTAVNGDVHVGVNVVGAVKNGEDITNIYCAAEVVDAVALDIGDTNVC